jgi:hypothetical protein
MQGSTIISYDQYHHSCPITGTVYGSTGRTFDGNDDLVNAGNATVLRDILTVTHIAWIYSTGAGGGTYGRIFDKGSDRGFMRSGTNSRLYYSDPWSGATGQWNTGNIILVNTWYHVALTYDGSLTTNDPIIYINGASVAVTEAATPSGTRTSDAANILYIGNNATADRCFAGTIGEYLECSRILTAGEILNNYLATKGRYQ